MRSSLLVLGSLVAAVSFGGCNRQHLYKTAGQATVAAFTAQAEGTDAPRPRGIDGDEATTLVHSEKDTFSSGDDDNGPGGAGGGPGSAPKPAGIPLQAR